MHFCVCMWCRHCACLATELYLDRRIDRVSHPPSALEFYRDYVSRSRPLLIEGGALHWPAMRLWRRHDYLTNQLAGASLTVARVPASAVSGAGLADSVVCGSLFVQPHLERMDMRGFLDEVERSRADATRGVVYYQLQSDS